MKLSERARQLKTDVPAVFLALKRKETPWYAKAVAALIMVYALSPVDLIPDFIPVLGYLDDLIVLPALIVLFVRLIPSGVMDECRAEAAAQFDGKKPKRWYYAIPFVLVWLLVLFFIGRAIYRAVK